MYHHLLRRFSQDLWSLKGLIKSVQGSEWRGSQSRSWTRWENRVCFRVFTTNTAGGMYIQTYIRRYLSAELFFCPVIIMNVLITKSSGLFLTFVLQHHPSSSSSYVSFSFLNLLPCQIFVSSIRNYGIFTILVNTTTLIPKNLGRCVKCHFCLEGKTSVWNVGSSDRGTFFCRSCRSIIRWA